MTFRTLAVTAAAAGILLAAGCTGEVGGPSPSPSPSLSPTESGQAEGASASPSPESSPSPSAEQESPPPDQGIVASWWLADDASEHGSVVAVTFLEDGLISVVGDPAGSPAGDTDEGEADETIVCGGEFDPAAEPPIDFSVECGEFSDLMQGPTETQSGTADLTENPDAGPGTVLEVTWDANGSTDYYTFTDTIDTPDV